METIEPQLDKNLPFESRTLRSFRRALRRKDQLVLDDLIAAAQKHTAAIVHSGRDSAFEVVLLAMLLEQHREVARLKALLGQEQG
jgi:hypothetical protein